MTTTSSQRVLLARIGELAWRAELLGNAQVTLEELRAIEAALRLPAGADWVLVPREPTPEMLSLALSHVYGEPFWREDARPIGTFYPGFTADESERANIRYCGKGRVSAAYAAMLTAAPRHETGE